MINKNMARRIIWAEVVTLFIVFVLFAWQPPNKDVPEQLVGEWHTEDPNYYGRSFEINLVSISFGTGEGKVTTGFINSIKEVREGVRVLYTVSYTLDGVASEVSFYYDVAKGEAIRFKNQQTVVWTKDKKTSRSLLNRARGLPRFVAFFDSLDVRHPCCFRFFMGGFRSQRGELLPAGPMVSF